MIRFGSFRSLTSYILQYIFIVIISESTLLLPVDNAVAVVEAVVDLSRGLLAVAVSRRSSRA